MNSAKITSLLAAACLLLGVLTLPAAAQNDSLDDAKNKGNDAVLDDKASGTDDANSGDKACAQDLTNDGEIDLDDLLEVLLSWGPCQRIPTGPADHGIGNVPPKGGFAECATDLDKSGRTDIGDLLLVLIDMGRTCQDVNDNP